MPRVDEEDVKEIMVGSTVTTKQITPFLDTANVMVTDRCAGTYGDDILKKIELWLTAHLTSATIDPQISKQKTGRGDATYHGKTNMGLDGTMYGQQVKLLDSDNRLKDDKRVSVDLQVILGDGSS